MQFHINVGTRPKSSSSSGYTDPLETNWNILQGTQLGRGGRREHVINHIIELLRFPDT